MPIPNNLSGMPLYPTKRPSAPSSAGSGGQEEQRLFLQVADQQGMRWAEQVIMERHYMQRRVHQRTRPMAMLVLQGERERRRVGCLIYNRPQCTAVRGWYCGSYQTLQAHPGEYRMTMWNLINLARVYLSPEIQRRESPSYVRYAASRVVGTSLLHVVRDYLLLFPPVHPDEPFELRECLSYCDRTRFFCTIYLATNFQEVRCNERGLVTFARPLRPLTPGEREEVLEASRASARQRKLRAGRRFAEEFSQPPLFERLWPVLTPEELGLALPSEEEVLLFGDPSRAEGELPPAFDWGERAA
jgi:hypothetical protein